jgi:hypothetical protein
MKSKKLPFLLPVGLALLLSTSILVVSISPTAFGQQQGTTGGQQQGTTGGQQQGTTGGQQQGTTGGQQQGTTGGQQQGTTGGQQQGTTGGQQQGTTGGQTGSTIDCQTAASTLGGLIIPNPTGTCDVAVPRQGLQVQDSATGATLNNLLVINPLFEFTQMPSPTGGGGGATGAANQAMVYGFAEFAFMEGELTSAMRMLSNSSWNVVAVHNHVIGESPSMIFAHAIANGDINTLVRDGRMILDSLMTQTQSQSQSGNQTTTTTGGMAGNATTTGGGITEGNMNNNSGIPSGVTGGTTDGGGGGGAGNGTTTGGAEGGNGGGGGPLEGLGDILGGGQ